MPFAQHFPETAMPLASSSKWQVGKMKGGSFTSLIVYSFVKKSAINSACFKTVSIAFACLSGG
jgi:hypothetical protein